MSLQNIEVPNNLVLYCDTLNCNTLNSTTQNITNLNATTINTGILNYTAPAAAYSSPITGALGGQTTVSGFFTRVGKTATLQVNGFSAPNPTAGSITFTTPLPVGARIITNVSIIVQNNGAFVLGTVNIDTSGNVTIFVGINTPFTGGLVVDGWTPFSVTYLTA